MNESATTQTRIRLLGRFEIRRGDRVLLDAGWTRRKAAALLKLLALQPGRSLHREQVYEALWPSADPESASNNLRQNLFHVRSALNGDATEDFITLAGDRVTLASSVAIDVEEFRELASSARESRDPRAYERALSLYEGELLPGDLYEAWTERARRDLHDLCNRLLIEASDLYETNGDHTTAIERLEALLAADHAEEEAHRALMRIYARSGQRQRALRQYERCREVLRAELDVEPSAETVTLYKEIAEGHLANGSPAPIERARAGADVEAVGFWSRGRLRLASLGIVLLAVAALAIGLAMDAVTGDSGHTGSVKYTTLSFHVTQEATARLVSGDCVSTDLVYNVDGDGTIGGALSGQHVVSATTTFPIEYSCRLGIAEANWPIALQDGSRLDSTLFSLVPLVNPVNGEPSGQSELPGAIVMATGSGDYEGLTGPGRCNVPQTSSPISPTELRVTGEGDCIFRLGPTGEQEAILMDAVTSWLSLSPAGTESTTPSSIILAAYYMNDTAQPLNGLRLRIPQPAGASLAVAHEDEEFVAAHDRSWSLPEIGPHETAEFFANVQLISSSRDEIVVIPEIYGEGLDDPVRSTPLHLQVIQ